MLHTIIDRLDRIENKLNNKATDQYIDINQASVFTSLSVSTLRRYVARGELKCCRKLGKLLFKESDIQRWLGGT